MKKIKYPRSLKSLFPKLFDKGMILATHRGYGKMGPIAENTIEAFRESTKVGFRAHELDVRLSKDGKLILFHGPNLQRTTSGFGKLEKQTFNELKKIDWGYYLKNSAATSLSKKTPPTNLPTAQKKRQKTTDSKNQIIEITTLDDYLKEFGKKCITNIEVKKEWYIFNRNLENRVIECVKQHKLEQRVLYSSFNILSMRYLRKKQAESVIGVLKDKGPALLPFWAPLLLSIFVKIVKPDTINLHPSLATTNLVKKYKDRGYGVLVWKINDTKIYDTMKKAGVDVAITDNINLLEEV